MYALLLYVVVHVVRIIVVTSLTPVLKAQGYGLSLDRGILIVWGGLRGAVSLALALSVTLDPIISSHDSKVAGLIFFHTSTIVMMTLLVNATSVRRLVEALGLHLVSPSKELLFTVAMREIDRAGEKEELNLKADPLFGCARWDDVRGYKWDCKPAETHPHVRNSISARGTSSGGSSGGRNSVKSSTSSSSATRKALSRATSFRQNSDMEANRRFLVAVKASYWQQFRDGLVGRSAVRDLIESVDSGLDSSAANEWISLSESLDSTKVSGWSHRLLKHRCTRPLALRYLFSRLRHGYDVISAFLVARQDAIDHIRAVFTGQNKIFQKTIEGANRDIEAARASLLTISRVLPEISATIATNHAARVILNTQRRTVHELKEEGVLDEMEAKRSVRAIELQMKRLLLHPQRFELPSADELLGEISWVSALDREARRKLKSAVVELLVQENDVLIEEGTSGTDVFLLARGGARVTQYIDGKEILIQNLQVGGVVGEMACIIGERRSASVTATTTSLFFQIPGAAMTELVEKSAVLREQLWTVCARRLAEITLSEHDPYRSMSRRSLRNTLQAWTLIDPPRRKFGGRLNGATRHSELTPTPFYGKIFLAYGMLTRRIINLDRMVSSKNASKTITEVGEYPGVASSATRTRSTVVPRGKSSKLLLDEEDRTSKYYEIHIFAPALLKPMLHEKCIMGWASPDAVLLSNDDSKLAHLLSSQLRGGGGGSGAQHAIAEEEEEVREREEEEEEKEKEEKERENCGGGRTRAEASKYSVMEMGGGGESHGNGG